MRCCPLLVRSMAAVRPLRCRVRAIRVREAVLIRCCPSVSFQSSFSSLLAALDRACGVVRGDPEHSYQTFTSPLRRLVGRRWFVTRDDASRDSGRVRRRRRGRRGQRKFHCIGRVPLAHAEGREREPSRSADTRTVEGAGLAHPRSIPHQSITLGFVGELENEADYLSLSTLRRRGRFRNNATARSTSTP